MSNVLRDGRIAQVWNALLSGSHDTARNLITNSPMINWQYELGLTYFVLYPKEATV